MRTPVQSSVGVDVGPEPVPASSLSAREYEVLHLVALGWLHSEIARELGISDRTVVHVRANAYRKLGGGPLVTVLRRLGWLRIPEAA